MTKGIQCSNFFGIRPRRMRTDIEDRRCQSQIRNIFWVQLIGCYCQSGVDTIASLVCSNRISLTMMTNCADHGCTDGRIWVRPRNRHGVDTERFGVGGERNVLRVGKLGLRNNLSIYNGTKQNRSQWFVYKSAPCSMYLWPIGALPLSVRAFFAGGPPVWCLGDRSITGGIAVVGLEWEGRWISFMKDSVAITDEIARIGCDFFAWRISEVRLSWNKFKISSVSREFLKAKWESSDKNDS